MTAADLHPDTSEPRPGTCCGACPPIAGGGWDCTCPGLPGCPVNAPGPRTVRERDAVAQDLAQLAARLAAVEAELQQQRHRTAEFQTIAAGFANRAVAAEDRLAAVEALIPELEADIPEDAGNATSHLIARRLRAVLAAPTDTTKEN